MIGTATLPLRSPGAQQMQSRRMRATTRWLAVAAGVALVAALGLERWRVQRQLTAVQRARADIAAPVRNAMSVRSEVESAADVASALAEREASASRVGGVLAAVALALPSGASLTAMHVAGDSVTVEGESSRSAAVYDALRAVPALEQVRLAAPLRQERQAGDVAVEHFAFSARLRHPAAPSRAVNR
jgi:Tfp pilus assembly protein PilN